MLHLKPRPLEEKWGGDGARSVGNDATLSLLSWPQVCNTQEAAKRAPGKKVDGENSPHSVVIHDVGGSIGIGIPFHANCCQSL